ncbi:unnamed protein product [Ambrosiozyma monospora]|uniref:Unnamed protein product n=1 Tax=Ambrosiozyma monospora TaxID=43982 RepID=A0ACB5T4Y0_AMBMO|nr:unnamed protein product [Ambrosiozyma monospora]
MNCNFPTLITPCTENTFSRKRSFDEDEENQQENCFQLMNSRDSNTQLSGLYPVLGMNQNKKKQRNKITSVKTVSIMMSAARELCLREKLQHELADTSMECDESDSDVTNNSEEDHDTSVTTTTQHYQRPFW